VPCHICGSRGEGSKIREGHPLSLIFSTENPENFRIFLASLEAACGDAHCDHREEMSERLLWEHQILRCWSWNSRRNGTVELNPWYRLF